MYLPVPRAPARASQSWPPTELLDSLAPDVAGVVEEAREVRSALRKALAALEAGRPGGVEWVRARQADKAALLSQDKRKRAAPKALAALMAGEHDRYALALALASSATERLDGLRERLATDSLIKATDSRHAEVAEEMAHAAEDAFTAAEEGAQSKAWTALERFDALAVESRQLVALRAWLVGESDAYTVPRAASVPGPVFRHQSEARTMLSASKVAS